MPITISPYHHFKAILGGGDAAGEAPIDYLSDTIKGALIASTYTPNLSTHDYWDDVSGDEVGAGNGYTAGGQTLASKTVTITGGNAHFDAADLTWTFTASKTFRYLVLYKDTGTASTSPLMFLLDFGQNRTEDATFTLQWHADGVFRIS